jgi:transcriptional regulator with XRE-family HTH domain
MVHIGFGKRLKELRTDRQLSQEDIARIAGVERSTVTKWETASSIPNAEILSLLADYFSISIDYLLDRIDDPALSDIENAHRRIEAAIADDSNADELLDFWKELKKRDDLFLLFKQVRPLSDDTIRKVIRIIKVIEDEEKEELNR